MRPLVLLALGLWGCATNPGQPAPGPLRAGVATVALDAPVGIPTGGYGRARRAEDPISAWADGHVPTVGVHTQPTARALALSNGVTTVVLVRVDLCLTVATLRWRAQELLDATGRKAPLVVMATHTHSGPARYFQPVPVAGTGGFDAAKNGMDSFDAEVETRLAASIAEAAAQALDAMRPAAVGVATVDAPELNSDRRCENDDLYGAGFRDSTLTVVRLDEVDAAGTPLRPMTGLLHFAVHGTMLDDDNHLLSGDVPGAMELYASDRVGVPLVFVQGAAGDVSPSTGPLGIGEFQGVERLGRIAARKVEEAWVRAAPLRAPERATLRHFALPVEPSRAAIGYAEGEFPENGAIGCGLGEAHCPPVEASPASIVCIPLRRRPFRETTVEALQLETVLFGTLPGEPTAAMGDRVKAAGARLEGVTNVLTAGYAQDHFGYLLEEKDYLRLGYEPFVSPLGWKFGDFIVGKLGEAMEHLGQSPMSLARPKAETFVPRPAGASGAAPHQVAPTENLRRLETATFDFEGGDPSLGTPRVSLEREVDGGFAPVRVSAVRFLEGGPDIVLFYEPLARWTTASPPQPSAHRWRAVWETVDDTATGRYRFVARGRAWVEGAESSFVLEGNPFTLSATDALGATGSATLSASGTLTAIFRLPPNPSVRDRSGTVVEHFRLRDEGSRPSEGARVRGGSARCALQSAGGPLVPLSLLWSEAQGAFVAGDVPVQGGPYRLVVPVGGLRDGAGNTNGVERVLNVAAD